MAASIHSTPCCVLQAGLKTGMYYLRTRAAADAIKFTVDQQALAKNKAARAAAAPKGLAATAATEPLKVLQHTLSKCHQHVGCIVLHADDEA